MSKKLTKEEKKFCKMYLKTRDPLYTKLTLGYTIDISQKHIITYIQSKPIKGDFEIDLDPIIRRLYAIATFDHSLMYDKDGDVKPWKCLTDEQKMAIKTYNELGDGTIKYYVHNQYDAMAKIVTLKQQQDKDIPKDIEDSEIEIKISIDPRSITQDD